MHKCVYHPDLMVFIINVDQHLMLNNVIMAKTYIPTEQKKNFKVTIFAWATLGTYLAGGVYPP